MPLSAQKWEAITDKVSQFQILTHTNKLVFVSLGSGIKCVNNSWQQSAEHKNKWKGADADKSYILIYYYIIAIFENIEWDEISKLSNRTMSS